MSIMFGALLAFTHQQRSSAHGPKWRWRHNPRPIVLAAKQKEGHWWKRWSPRRIHLLGKEEKEGRTNQMKLPNPKLASFSIPSVKIQKCRLTKIVGIWIGWFSFKFKRENHIKGMEPGNKKRRLCEQGWRSCAHNSVQIIIIKTNETEQFATQNSNTCLWQARIMFTMLDFQV